MTETSLAPLTVADRMSREVKTLDRNETLDVVDDVMALGRLRHLPVVDGTRVVGVVSERDLFRSALAAALGYGLKARRTLLHTIHVKEVMSEPPVTVPPSTPMEAAIRLMLKRKIGCLPVVEDGALVGLLTETDVLQYAVRH